MKINTADLTAILTALLYKAPRNSDPRTNPFHPSWDPDRAEAAEIVRASNLAKRILRFHRRGEL